MTAEKRSVEGEKVSAVEVIREEMRDKIRRLAWPSEPGEGVKGCIRRVSRMTGLTFGQVKALWYGEWRRIPADIADVVREATDAHEKRLDARLAGLRERQQRFWALTHCSHDTDFYRGQIDGLGREDDDRG